MQFKSLGIAFLVLFCDFRFFFLSRLEEYFRECICSVIYTFLDFSRNSFSRFSVNLKIDCNLKVSKILLPLRRSNSDESCVVSLLDLAVPVSAGFVFF